jgi:hypothetical protein
MTAKDLEELLVVTLPAFWNNRLSGDNRGEANSLLAASAKE